MIRTIARWVTEVRKPLHHVKVQSRDGIRAESFILIPKCSLDGQLKQWRLNHDDVPSAWKQPLSSVLMKWAPHCMDHHPTDDELLIGGAESCLLYSALRMDVPIREWTWGREPVHCVKFNPVECNVACALLKDNSLMLLDSRQDLPLRKVIPISNSYAFTVCFVFVYLMYDCTVKDYPGKTDW
ncbi:unnamed protein product [Echinostoma caproni]|uniref:TFIIIC_delta domain-containing protein n=1 Tax=Echinostoma caproni TaxID=27848 RepID=A0A183B342_9TREM|nr:unnamed protein product [Echinostoma caproni]